MSNLTAAEIYAINRQAGFDPISAAFATAIALAESGGNPKAIGDENNPTPGSKSVGLFQINYSPARDSKVTYRDPVSNLDPLQNARSAFIISNGGKNFGPWTTWKNGDYKKFFNSAMRNVPDSAVPITEKSEGFDWGAASIWGPLPAWIAKITGKELPAPAHASSDDITAAIKDLNPLTLVQKTVFTALFLAAGIGLVVLGTVRATGIEGKIIPGPIQGGGE